MKKNRFIETMCSKEPIRGKFTPITTVRTEREFRIKPEAGLYHSFI